MKLLAIRLGYQKTIAKLLVMIAAKGVMGYSARPSERWMSGLSRTPGKRVWDNIPTGVRIPPSPPLSH
jgi:hypothetical protein